MSSTLATSADRRGLLRVAQAAVAGLAAATCFGLPGQVAHADPPVIGDSPGTYRLGNLEHGPDRPVEINAPAAFRFALPAGAAPGKPYWFTLGLHGRASFAGTAAGHYQLSASVNGYACAQVQFDVTANSVTAHSLGLVTGQQSRFATGRTVEFDYVNYLQDASDTAGPASLVVELAELSGVPRPSATVVLAPSSALTATSLDYRELGLGVPVKGVGVRRGHTVRLPFVVERRGGRPDGPTSVRARVDGSGVQVVGADSVAYDAVGRKVTGGFILRGRRPGRYLVQVSVPARYNQPAQIVLVTVTAASAGGAPTPRTWGSVALLAAAAGLMASVVRARRR